MATIRDVKDYFDVSEKEERNEIFIGKLQIRTISTKSFVIAKERNNFTEIKIQNFTSHEYKKKKYFLLVVNIIRKFIIEHQ